MAAPPLRLGEESFVLGADVGILGFPMGERLQGATLRPVAARTVLGSAIEPTPENGLLAGKVVLSYAVAGGFSGSPVFSADDGAVVGMVSSKPLESTPQGTWPAGLSLAVLPSDISTVLDSAIQVTTREIKLALHERLRRDGDDTARTDAAEQGDAADRPSAGR